MKTELGTQNTDFLGVRIANKYWCENLIIDATQKMLTCIVPTITNIADFEQDLSIKIIIRSPEDIDLDLIIDTGFTIKYSASI